MTSQQLSDKYDVIIVGGGHNGLTAAAYLAKAGVSVLLLERLDHTGGAAVSTRAFAGLPARLSRYSYLVSLLPQQIISDLGLDVELRSRTTASYTPVVRDGRHTGLLVERPEAAATAESFRSLTGSDQEYDAWRRFYGEVSDFAEVVAPTLLEPLRTARQVREMVEADTWEQLVEQPLGAAIEKRFADDTVRGVVATDALIGTFAGMNDESLVQNRCFLYHLVGNGTGEWRVPVGGMGAVTDALAVAARNAGATIVTNAGVSGIETDGSTATVTWHAGDRWQSAECDFVLSNVAPWVLQVLLGEDPGERPEGSQLKVNLLVERLPRFKSGVTPKVALSGTCHVAEDYSQLEEAYQQAAAGELPTVQPGEIYCHSLTDPSIMGTLAVDGLHTLTYFGVHTPARLFATDLDGQRDRATEHALDAINEHLEEPIESLLVLDKNGHPCLETKAPQDIDEALAMPGGHIFHGDLTWPWAPNRARLETPAQRWGVATEHANILLCGSGARRGGAVSGIGGHNAAQAVLEARRSG
ncbi:phytoene desaturase family protein [Nocardioides mesophilus]|uniref:Pyridine nucleotide-disulfide oxidoreductase domain-containing protein 2 n=1 Tax=Nocardioides mesophilus TaxID=433659 RepID=A0A7G9RCX3_9ACTN|nr:NAD(P)/FAD-dependent oxidoreductase [Nocardioides mesophilus]QNN53448.1 NAD(P)/FAD-dependent oxidoreductase [Nocardioides mesophilus]